VQRLEDRSVAGASLDGSSLRNHVSRGRQSTCGPALFCGIDLVADRCRGMLESHRVNVTVMSLRTRTMAMHRQACARDLSQSRSDGRLQDVAGRGIRDDRFQLAPANGGACSARNGRP
jgi:hypothetical protein